MRLSELISRVRKKVNDPRGLYWSDVEIASDLNLMARSMFRQKCDAHVSYGRRILDLSVTDNATQLEQLEPDVWLWTLPAWVYRVQKVFSRQGNLSFAEIPLSSGNNRTGWSYNSNRAIAVCGNSAAIDLRLSVQKTPALMFRGTGAADAPDLGSILIPVTLAVETTPAGFSTVTEAFPIDLEDGALLGATLEVTSANATHDPRGVLGTVKAQSREYNTTLGAYQHVLDVLPSYADFVKVSDTFESHCEIEDVHALLLILRTAESLFHKTNNVAGVNVLQTQLAREERLFNNSLQPRESNVFHVMQTEEDVGERRDPDRDSALAGW